MLTRGRRAVSFRRQRRRNRETARLAAKLIYRSGAWSETFWLGAQAVKNPLDLWIYQAIVTETRPELIVETGTYRGGSGLYLASICELLGAGEVVSIDIRPVSDEYPSHPRLSYLGGRSSTDSGVVAEVRERAARKRTMVVLDSDHSQAHVEAE